ncbi:alpha/beta hydrolase [Cyanobium sp. FGCU-6]|jgi:predicted alpha/beta-hydrolase family hydrolase|nr:alpha/beta hydrolase [Cyanobium sp. FGCU6]
MNPADSAPTPQLFDGLDNAPATVLLAHGAGAPMDSPFMAAIAAGLATRGWRVLRFEFPYMARQRSSGGRHGPDRLPVLEDTFRRMVRQQADAWPGQPLVLAGKSMGGRVASLLVDELAEAAGVRGCLCLGYPFHPPGRPLQLRTEHLASLHSPTLILQGERDSFGRREEVAGYSLSQHVQVQWIPAGDHSFKPTRSSGLSEAQNWATAVACSDAFLRSLLHQ